MEVTAPAVAENVAEEAPARTVTEAGTVTAVVLLLANDTVEPPVGAAWLRVTVHVLAAPASKETGLHVKELKMGVCSALTVKVLLPPETETALPAGEAPIVLIKLIGPAPDVEAAVTFTKAAIPF